MTTLYATCIYTVVKNTPETLSKITDFWKSFGISKEFMVGANVKILGKIQ